MPDVAFYHLTRQPVAVALPKLLERVIASGARAIVRAGSSEKLVELDRMLWTYDADSFLPHGMDASDHQDLQPILLTLAEAAPNGATIAVVLDDAWPATAPNFARVLYLFEAYDPDQMTAARSRWKDLKTTGWPLTYWSQTDSGGWEKKAEG